MARHRVHRIVLTGGPGGGKTTAADLMRREIGEQIVIVPEAGTLLFAGGFPRDTEGISRKATQTAIYQVQRNLETVVARQYPNRTLLCDRGTADGGAYWPEGPDDYFFSMGTTLKAELARYDAVVFFESAALGGRPVIEGGNPTRTESVDEAVELDSKLRNIWEQHDQFHLIRHDDSFIKKVAGALGVLTELIQ